MACRPELFHASQEVSDLRRRVAELEAENGLLSQRVEGLTAGLRPPDAPAAAGAPAPRCAGGALVREAEPAARAAEAAGEEGGPRKGEAAKRG